MRDAVLQLDGEFGKGLVVALRDEDRIVSEAAVASFFRRDGTADDAFKGGRSAPVERNKRNYCAELSLAVGDPIKESERLLAVVGRVAVVAGPASGINARIAVQGFNFEARIICEAAYHVGGKAVSVLLAPVIDKLSLLEGVTLQGRLRLGNVLVQTDLCETQDMMTRKDGSGLLQFVGIVGCKDECHIIYERTRQK